MKSLALLIKKKESIVSNLREVYHKLNIQASKERKQLWWTIRD